MTATIETVTVEALLPNGEVWVSFRFPLPGEAPENPQAEIQRVAKAIRQAAEEEGVVLKEHLPLQFTQRKMAREEHYETVHYPTGSRAMDRLIFDPKEPAP